MKHSVELIRLFATLIISNIFFQKKKTIFLNVTLCFFKFNKIRIFTEIETIVSSKINAALGIMETKA